jgi:hypothetical protein
MAGGFLLRGVAVETQTSAQLGAASSLAIASAVAIAVDAAFAMHVSHATIECALGAAYAAGA